MAAPESALSRRSTIAPISANEREERAQREVRIGLTDRLVSEQRGALVAHLVLLTVAVWLLSGVARPPLLIAWAGAVLIAVFVRVALMTRLKSIHLTPQAATSSVRLSVLGLGLAWGVGIAVITPEVPMRYVTLLLVTEAGLVSGAAWTLTSDLWSFRIFMITMLAPLPIGIMFNATPDSARAREAAVILIVLYMAYMWILGQRSHLSLVATLRAGALLRIREEETSRQNAFLGALFASAPIAMAEVSEDGLIERINPRFVTLFGWAEHEAVGQMLDGLMVPPGERMESVALHHAILQGRPMAKDLRRMTKSGTMIDVLVTAAAVNRSDGSRGIVALYEDVTERRRSEAQVRELSERLAAVLGAATQVSIIATDLDGIITVFNAGAEQMLGYRADEVVEVEPFERILVASEITARSRDVLRETGHQVEGFEVLVEPARRGSYDQREWTYVRKDGKRLTVELVVTPLRDGNGQIAGFLGVATDVTQRNRQAAALREAEAHFRQLLDSSGEGIYGVDGDGRITFFNPEASNLTGYSLKDALGRDAHDLLHHTRPDGTSYAVSDCPISQAFRTGQGIRLEEEVFWKKDGSAFPVALTAFPMRELGGGVSGAVITFADTSERVAARAAIEHAREAAEQTARTRSAFLANMSHEIRTPLNAILGLTELLFDTPLAPEQRHSLELVRGAGETLLTLLNDILDLSKIEADQLRLESIPFDPEHLIESTLALLAIRAREKRLDLITDVQAGVPVSVRGDPTRLRQILTNLVGNAIKFTDRGEVVVGVGKRDPSTDGDVLLHFTVRDTGIGIPADKLEAIFEEFTQADSSTTRRYGGTGLGLAICRRLVRLQGGELRVESEVGKGTEFSFSLRFPVEKATATPALGTPAALIAKILVVDDNETNRRIVREMLQAAGSHVEETGDASTVHRTLLDAVAEKKPYALVILDGQMPEIDGFSLAAELRKDPALTGLRLMLLTSAALPGDGQRCRELGIQGYLPKPASRADLLDAVASVLHGKVDRQVVTRHSMAEARRGIRILLAEDNPVNQQVAATMLRKRGHQVDVVDNGRDAVAAVAKNQYDIVLMDIQMPELDGMEATAEIRKTAKGKHLPIVALTAHALTGDREKYLSAGMNGYLSKPFKPHELFAAAEGWPASTGESVAIREPETQAEVPPAADLERLRRELTEAGAADALGAILDTFLTDAPKRMETLITAVKAGDAVAISKAAHAFKSASATIGAAGLAKMLADIEHRGKAKDVDGLGAIVEAAKKEADRVLEQVTTARPSV